MNEEFINNIQKLIINDEGIEYHANVLNRHVFFPYGSMSVIKMKFSGGLLIQSGDMACEYTPNGNEKNQLKALLPTIQNKNASAPKADYSIIDNIVLEKNIESFKNVFGAFKGKDEQKWHDAMTNMIDSMSDDEKILHHFTGHLMFINGGRESVAGFISVITTKRFYYAGNEGKAVLSYLKTGAIELKDVHAITIGAQTLTFPAYVQFEVKNDNYKVGTYSDTKKIKASLEEGIKACESKTNSPTVVQAAVSAADELKKFKELLDMGIITQEEFDAKKKQLLGL